MNETDLFTVLRRVGIVDLSQPNHAGWCHCECPFAPWRHKGGVDRSRGFALKVEENGISAYTCPVCKAKGRIDALLMELGQLRGVDYRALAAEVRKIETIGAALLPTWEERHRRNAPEQLGAPLDPVAFDPEQIFDPITDHEEAIRFCQHRRVSADGAAKAGMRFDPDKRRIVFPVYDGRGNLYGFTGRTVLPKEQLTYWSQREGREITLPKVLDYANLPKRLLILGEHRWRRGRGTVIVEGLFAYARFLTEGVDDHYNLGALLGSEMTPGKAAILRNWGLPVYLILDNDAAGAAGIFGHEVEVGRDRDTGEPVFRRDVTTGALWALADHVPTYVPAYPEGVDDPDYLSLAQVLAMCRDCPPSAKPRPQVKKPAPGHRS